jgi:hypothetical protein
MHDAFAGGVNVWMAYDWVYPPRKGGEALIHVEWGNDYQLKKPYWIFRQWTASLSVGMKVIEVASYLAAMECRERHCISSRPMESQSSCTLSTWPTTIDQSSSLPQAQPGEASQPRASAPVRPRTMFSSPPLTPGADGLSDTLPARSLTTFQITRK